MKNLIAGAFIFIMIILSSCTIEPEKKSGDSGGNTAIPKWGHFEKKSGSASYNYFGISVAISGNFAIVGEPDYDNTKGAVYIYKKSILTGEWGNGIRITASDGADNDNFGFSVAITNGYAIVGAPYKKSPGGFNAGAVYVYRYIGGGLTNTWDAGDCTQSPYANFNGYFGYSVGISGDYAVVGIPYGSKETLPTVSQCGLAYIMHRVEFGGNPNRWLEGVALLADNPEYLDFFGATVAINGDYAVIGAMGKAVAPMTQSGKIYIYHRTASNAWAEFTAKTAPSSIEKGYFGSSVAIDGSYVIIGAKGDNQKGENSGASYVYQRTGSNTWDIGVKITASDGGVSDNFGYSVGISGDYAIVGAFKEDENSSNIDADYGAVYIFQKNILNEWDFVIKNNAPTPAISDNFGISVSISGDNAIAGSKYADTSAYTDCGAAYFIY